MSGDARLVRLLDERAIERKLAQFARLLDARAWSQLEDVFAADVAFDYALGEQRGLEALRATMRRFLDPCGPSQHLIGNVVVDVDDDRAVSRAYVQARHQTPDAALQGVYDASGEYVDTWARGAAGWRIIRREATWSIHSGNPAILGANAADLG